MTTDIFTGAIFLRIKEHIFRQIEFLPLFYRVSLKEYVKLLPTLRLLLLRFVNKNKRIYFFKRKCCTETLQRMLKVD